MLYGIALANFVFNPFAENLRERTKHELLTEKTITIDMVITIESEDNSRLLESKLHLFSPHRVVMMNWSATMRLSSASSSRVMKKRISDSW